MIAKVLDFIVENQFGCYLYSNDGSILTSGTLYKHYDDRGVPVYSIDYDKWIMRDFEVIMADFEKNNDVGLYLAI